MRRAVCRPTRNCATVDASANHPQSQTVRGVNVCVVHTCNRHFRVSTTQPCSSSGSSTGPMHPVTVSYPEDHKPIKLALPHPTPTPRRTSRCALRSERLTLHLSKAPYTPASAPSTHVEIAGRGAGAQLSHDLGHLALLSTDTLQ